MKKAGEEGSKETTKERIIPITVTPDDTSALEGLQEASGLPGPDLRDPYRRAVRAPRRARGPEHRPVRRRVVDEKGEIRRVPVTVGLFAGDRVEVSGDGITEGQRVVVPNR